MKGIQANFKLHSQARLSSLVAKAASARGVIKASWAASHSAAAAAVTCQRMRPINRALALITPMTCHVGAEAWLPPLAKRKEKWETSREQQQIC